MISILKLLKDTPLTSGASILNSSEQKFRKFAGMLVVMPFARIHSVSQSFTMQLFDKSKT